MSPSSAVPLLARVQPWQVWWIDFSPQLGREQASLRPGIVIGSALSCRLPNQLALVLPCTRTDRNLPWQPRIALGEEEAIVMCDQVKSLDLRRFTERHKCASVTNVDDQGLIRRALYEIMI